MMTNKRKDEAVKAFLRLLEIMDTYAKSAPGIGSKHWNQFVR